MSGSKHCRDVLRTVEHPPLTGLRPGPHEPVFGGGGLEFPYSAQRSSPQDVDSGFTKAGAIPFSNIS